MSIVTIDINELVVPLPPLTPSVYILARTLYGEARGCGEVGMSHVANVVMNRVRNPRWWGDDVVHVCQAPEQFSCWNHDDPNYAKIISVTTEDHQFATALQIATNAVQQKLHDATDGADSYYALSMSKPPYWADRAVRTIDDGWHVFMRVDLPAPDGGPDAPNVSINSVSKEEVVDARPVKVPRRKDG